MNTFHKTIAILAAGFGFCLSAHAQTATIHAIVKDSSIKELRILHQENGRTRLVTSSKISEDGKTDIDFSANEEGLYALAYPENKQLTYYKFYFKPGDQLNIQINKKGYKLTGKNTKENKAMANWYETFQPLDTINVWALRNISPSSFFELVEKTADKTAHYKMPKTGNPKFEAFLPKMQQMDLAHQAIGFLLLPRHKVLQDSDLSPWYFSFSPDELLKHTDLLQVPYCDKLLTELTFLKTRKMGSMTFDERLMQIPNDTLKGHIIIGRLHGIGSYVQFKELANTYMKYLTKAQQQELPAMEAKLADTKPGKAAANFSFQDVEGKPHSLYDFKGKLVLVDLWATWCGPCKAEEPFWVKLNEQFAGKDVVFVGISLDRDKAAWEKYVHTRSPKGLHLHADKDETISKEYSVTGIPRYLLFDKSSNIITVDAPRPSDPGLARILDEWLKK
jgi:thiol-disulfide isomerase/thioredoxin